MQRAVAHEVADELSQVGCHLPRYESAVIRRPVSVGKWGQPHLGGVADHAPEHHRNAVAGANIAEAPPRPLARSVNNLDAMRCGALNPVATAGSNSDDRLCAVYEEFGGSPWSLICGDLGAENLPLVAVRITQPLQPDEAAIGEYQGVADETSRGREDCGLRVAVAVCASELDRIVPRVARSIHDVGRFG